MKRILYFFILIPFILCAQNTENDTLRLKADLALTGFWQGGNVQTLIFRANSNISFKPFKNTTFRTQNSYVLQEFGGDKADEDILSLNFININSHKRFHPLLLGFFSTNFRRQIDDRYIFGGGFSYQLINKNKYSLRISLTGEFEHTEFNTTDFKIDDYDGESEINTWRSTQS